MTEFKTLIKWFLLANDLANDLDEQKDKSPSLNGDLLRTHFDALRSNKIDIKQKGMKIFLKS